MLRPMLASPMKQGVVSDWNGWWLEEKFDGHRLMVTVMYDGRVSAHARPRGDGRMLERELSSKLVHELSKLTPGVYDGELLPPEGDFTSTDVSRLDLKESLRYVVFDVLEYEGVSVMFQTYEQRRTTLAEEFAEAGIDPKRVWLAHAEPAVSEKNVTRFVSGVWDDNGEGAILKLGSSKYHEGQRSGQRGVPVCWIKLKRVEHAALTVVGFEPSRGTVRFPGHPFAVIQLRDEDGNETTVKTKDDYELKRLTDEWLKKYNVKTLGLHVDVSNRPHPWVGRKLVIEFQNRTRDGGYRGPVRMDRWEDE